MKWRWFFTLAILWLWALAVLAQALIGDAVPLVPIFTTLLIFMVGFASIAEGIARGRDRGWSPEIGDDDPDHSWFGEDAIKRVGIWYSKGKISVDQLEVLIEHVLADPKRNGVWASHAKLVAQAANLIQRHEVKEPVPDPAAERRPKLPPGYFDGNISADEPEDPTDWAEVRHGMSSSYWLRTK